MDTRSNDYEIVMADPKKDSAAICAYTDAIGRESEFTTISPEEGYWLTPKEEEKRLKDLQDSKTGVCMLAKDSKSGEVIAWAQLITPGRNIAHVFDLGINVRKSHWRRGIGKALTLAIIQEAKNNLGAEQVTLTVVAANEGAVAMYQNLGFETVGTHRRTFKTIPGGVYHDEIIMAKFL